MSVRLRNVLLAAAVVLCLAILPAVAQKPAAQSIPYGELRLGDGGYLRVSAIGLPPFGTADRTTAREVARQNAMGLAQRRLLSSILDLPVPGTKQAVRDRLANKSAAKDRLRALIAKAKVSGQELADGSAEVTLELPYSGSGGLSEFLATLTP
ncbi:MAG TPA: hypothetical protein V6D05_05430 [Stenomitos sp.]